MRVLAGDIGGTHSRLLVCSWVDAQPQTVFEQNYLNADCDDPMALLRAFLEEAGVNSALDAACLAIAGPVEMSGTPQSATLTNLPWTLNSERVAETLFGTPTTFINDFEAIGWGLPHLTPDNVTTLQRGSPDERAPRAALGAGSGLGTVIALAIDDSWCIIPSEGGHADLAPGDAGELALLATLWERYGHASWERLLSGPGLEFLYRFQRGIPADAPTELSAPQISRAALEGSDADAVAALRTFCRLYGAQAGNLALTVLPRGGLFLAGGIAPQVLKTPFDEAFLDRFLAKGRLRPALERIPVHCITSPRTGLLGAAHYARFVANR